MIIRALALITALMLGGTCWAREVVNVGGYQFEPYVEFGDDGKPSGLAVDLIAEMNRHQDRYEFRFVPTSPRRRYKDFEDHKFDLVLFENPDWEWRQKGLPVETSQVILKGGDLYIALAMPGRTQSYFDDFTGRRVVGILGYHFGFAGFSSDPEVLTRKFNMTLVNDNAGCIGMILKGRADLAMVTDHYLFRYLKRHPDAAAKLLISERYDQKYDLSVLMRRGGPVGVAEMNQLLTEMEADGTLGRLWRASGIAG